MSRESLDALERAPLVGERADEDVAARLLAVERAYRDLQRRVERYERERREIRSRLEGLLSRLATLKTP
jgi:chromosome segregation ATPase